MSVRYLTVFVLFIVVGSAGAAVFVYAYFHSSLTISADPAAWGQLGDFFGGVLNPIFSSATIAGLLFTIYIQTQEIRAAREANSQQRKEMALAAEARDAAIDTAERQHHRTVLDDLQRAIDVQRGEIDTHRYLAIDDGPLWDLADQHVREVTLSDSAADAPTPDIALITWGNALDKLLWNLADTLDAYDDTANLDSSRETFWYTNAVRVAYRSHMYKATVLTRNPDDERLMIRYRAK